VKKIDQTNYKCLILIANYLII